MKVRLVYFKPAGQAFKSSEYDSKQNSLPEIWGEVAEMRKLGRLPGLNPGIRTVIVLIYVPEIKGPLHLEMPPAFDDEDHTPVREIPLK